MRAQFGDLETETREMGLMFGVIVRLLLEFIVLALKLLGLREECVVLCLEIHSRVYRLFVFLDQCRDGFAGWLR